MKDFSSLTTRGRARRLRPLAVAALQHYDLAVKRIRLITNDFNCIFRVDTAGGTKYILRVCLPDANPAKQLPAEVAWLHALRRDTDLSVPAPIPTHNGTYTVQVEAAGVPEPRYCVVFSWLPGPDLDQQLTPQNIERYGAFAARLHQHGATFTPPENSAIYTADKVFPFDEPIILFDEEYKDALPPARREVFQNVIQRVQEAVDRLKDSGEPMRVLHGDLHRWNVKVYRGKIAAFDFEELMWGWPVQDIGTTLFYFHGEPTYPDIRAAFERGYTSVAPWPERYAGEVDTFIAGRNIVLANAILQDHNPDWLAEVPRYFEFSEKRLRALLAGETFNERYW